MDDLLAILTVILGNGALITFLTIYTNIHTRKSETRLKARKDAHKFYLTLYSDIAYLDELMRAYATSKSNGKARVFIRDQGFVESSLNEIATNFGKAYDVFLSYYKKKKCSGYEIYLSKRLWKLLLDFQSLFPFDFKLENMTPQDHEDAYSIVFEIREQMEKYFGLK
jgi:hypothetical protein